MSVLRFAFERAQQKKRALRAIRTNCHEVDAGLRGGHVRAAAKLLGTGYTNMSRNATSMLRVLRRRPYTMKLPACTSMHERHHEQPDWGFRLERDAYFRLTLLHRRESAQRNGVLS